MPGQKTALPEVMRNIFQPIVGLMIHRSFVVFLFPMHHPFNIKTACYSKGNGGRYGYYKCPHCSKFNYSAIKANIKFIEYIRKLKPKDSTLELYEEIVNDLRKTNSKDSLKEIKTLQTELLKEEERLRSIDVKIMDVELSSEDFQRMKRNITMRKDKINTKLESLNPLNTNVLEKAKTEELDQKSDSSVSVPGAGLFSEPYFNNLDLLQFRTFF